MKKYFLFLLILFSGLLVFSQNTNTFSKVKYFVGDSTTNSFSIHSMVNVDSNYYLTVSSVDSTTFQSLFVFKTDLDGNVLDYYHDYNTNVDYFSFEGKGIIMNKDSNLVLCCYKRLSDYRRIGYVVKLNLSLDTLWSKSFIYPDTTPGCTGNEPTLKFNAIHETVDSGYILIGTYYYDCVPAPESVRTFLLKLDANGNEEWRRMYMDKSYSFSIDVTDDGGYVFPDWYKPGWWIVKTDSLGNELWATMPNDSVHNVSMDIKFKDDYVVAVSPYGYKNTSDPYGIKFGLDIVKLDESTGQIIWNKQYRTYKSFGCVTLHQDMEVEISDNDDIIIAATTSEQGVNGQYYANRGLLFKLNSQGDSLWCRFYDVRRDQDLSQFNDVILTDDGGYLAGGFFKPYDHSYGVGALLVKTDSMGMAPNAITLDIGEYLKKQNETIQVYPNPAENIITFDAGKIHSFKDGLLMIYNSEGQQIRQLFLDSPVRRINIKKLKPGVYFYRLQSDGKEYKGKFMKM